MFKYIGATINDYYIQNRVDETRFKVKCIHCGEEKELTMATLSGGLKDKNKCICSCSRSGIKIGDKFGKLTVIARDLDNQEYGRLAWKCKCDCGNIVTIRGKELKNGNTKSCGCLITEKALENLAIINSNLEDLTGQRSGKLVVIRQAVENEIINKPKGSRYWLCKCDCGNIHIVSTSDFKSKKVQSCGCLNSKGEAKISQLLEENKINYAKQFYFDDLTNNQGRKFYFDFGIIDTNGNLLYLIEYDGIQHFSKTHQFSKDSDTLLIIQNRDKIKNNYCFKNKIPLIRIPYTIKDIVIEDLTLETSKYLVKENI